MSYKIRCLKCGDIIETKHRHDFQQCKCGACYIDGGGDPKYIEEIRDGEED